jgi:hypothetical protein
VLSVNQSVSASASGWHSVEYLRWLLLIVALASIVLAAIHLTQSTGARSAIPAPATMALAGLAGLAWLWVIFRELKVPGVGAIPSSPSGVSIHFYRALGILLAFSATFTMLFAALAASRHSDA